MTSPQLSRSPIATVRVGSVPGSSVPGGPNAATSRVGVDEAVDRSCREIDLPRVAAPVGPGREGLAAGCPLLELVGLESGQRQPDRGHDLQPLRIEGGPGRVGFQPRGQRVERVAGQHREPALGRCQLGDGPGQLGHAQSERRGLGRRRSEPVHERVAGATDERRERGLVELHRRHAPAPRTPQGAVLLGLGAGHGVAQRGNDLVGDRTQRGEPGPQLLQHRRRVRRRAVVGEVVTESGLATQHGDGAADPGVGVEALRSDGGTIGSTAGGQHGADQIVPRQCDGVDRRQAQIREGDRGDRRAVRVVDPPRPRRSVRPRRRRRRGRRPRMGRRCGWDSCPHRRWPEPLRRAAPLRRWSTPTGLAAACG